MKHPMLDNSQPFEEDMVPCIARASSSAVALIMWDEWGKDLNHLGPVLISDT